MVLNSGAKKATMDSDGIGGLNDWYAGVYGTPYPTEVLPTQTWNKDLTVDMGAAMPRVRRRRYLWLVRSCHEHAADRFQQP